MKAISKRLLFVYNADSGLGNALLDTAHKVLNPATYSCSLCQLTYGAIMEKKNWRSFRERSEIPMRFLHRDEFVKEYFEEVAFPAIFLEQEGLLRLCISAEELDTMDDEQELIRSIQDLMTRSDMDPTSS